MLQLLDKEKTLNLAPQNSPKYAEFEITKQKICPSPDLFPGGEWNNPPHTLLPSALRPPNFELALTPLGRRQQPVG